MKALRVFARDLWRDGRYSARSLARSKVLVIVALLSVALAIGATTAGFALVGALRLEALPYPNAERVVELGATVRGSPLSAPVPYETYAEWRKQLRTVDLLTGTTSPVTDVPTIDVDGEPRPVNGVAVGAGYFELVGTRAIVGRLLVPNDDRMGAAPAVVLADP